MLLHLDAGFTASFLFTVMALLLFLLPRCLASAGHLRDDARVAVEVDRSVDAYVFSNSELERNFSNFELVV